MDSRPGWKWSFLLILKKTTLNLAKKILCLVFSAVLSSACSQNEPIDKPRTKEPDFGRKIDGLISFTVPLLSVNELLNNKDKFIIKVSEQIKRHFYSDILKIQIGFVPIFQC
jgi:hypothetical protein